MSGLGDPAETFRQEAQELLEQLEQCLLDLDDNPADQSLIDSTFRALHTIKGSGSMFGFDDLAAFTHHLETAFDLVRKGKVPLRQGLIRAALQAKDHIRALIETPDTVDPRAGNAILSVVIGFVEDHGVGTPAPPPPPEEDPVDAVTDAPTSFRIRFRLPADAMTLGTNPLRLLDEMRELGECTVVAVDDTVPSLEDIDPTACYVHWDVFLTTEHPASAIDDVFLFVRDDMELDVERLPAVPKRLGEILVDRGELSAEVIDRTAAKQHRLGDMLVHDGVLTETALKSALAEQGHLRQEAEIPVQAAQAAAKQTDSVRVPAERLDSLMDQVGELVIAHARLKQIAAGTKDIHVKAIAEEIERLAASLRDTTMGIRMVPIGSLFGRFRRLVHDLSHSLNKEVRLTTSGAETELDKTVIERLADPLVHLIRNCIDHGLEDTEGRAAAGKSSEGEVHLSARHSGAQVWVTIRDDGRGMNLARIRARAEEQGLVVPGAKMTDSELYQCIFLPGFSTAKEITNVSGRGVGMDVVKRTIEALRGTIDIASFPGQGSEITLRLPLTLAIIDGLLVRVGNGRYVIPLSAVEECVELSVAQDTRSSGRSFLNIRNALVPFLRLREDFAVKTPADPYQKVVIVSAGDQRIGLVVDQVIGDHQTVIKSLSKLHADVQRFSGATILGDGSVALILDVGYLIGAGQALDETLRAL
jgi:two-component system chemotaxis sensor kinase CheA